jgi:uridylate kinase
MPYFSTDTVAAQRALEIGCDVLLLAKSGVDGVYDADPQLDSTAVKFDDVSYDEVLGKGLKVADARRSPCAARTACRSWSSASKTAPSPAQFGVRRSAPGSLPTETSP